VKLFEHPNRIFGRYQRDTSSKYKHARTHTQAGQRLGAQCVRRDGTQLEALTN